MTSTPDSSGDALELAWAAGFFDGEGGTYGASRLALQVSQSEIGPLERFFAAVDGVGHIYGPYETNRGRPYFAYRAHGLDDIHVVLLKLWPYLGETKRAQARNALVGWITNGKTKRNRRAIYA